MKIAAIDIGTNSIHMIVADVRPDLSFEVIDREKEMVRLGAGGLGGRALSDAAMMPALRVLAKFKRLIDSLGVDEIRATATSAIREAPNGGAFLAALERQTGIRARVITGVTEGRLLHQAAMYGVDAAGGRAVVIDIGGGSTEITLGTAAAVEFSRSFLLGSIRLTERFIKSDPLEAGDERRLVKHIRARVDAFLDEMKEAGFDRVIGTSGTTLALAEIAFAAGGVALSGGLHHRSLTADDLHRTRKMLVSLNLSRRLRLPGLDPRRADLIVAGAVLLDTLVRRLGVPEITLCEFALREGLVLDYIRRHRDRIARVESYPDIRRRSVVELAERCRYAAPHAEQVARLALSLFDQVHAAREIPDRAREWLEYAALLHDIGDHVGYAGHHRHSHYLIRHGGLRGFDPDEVEAIGLIARYHRRGAPKKSHAEYAALPSAVRNAVRVAAAVLRVAECLDRSHAQVVDAVDLQDRGDGAALVVKAHDNVELEVWAAERQLGPLERVIDRHIRVETAGGSHDHQPHHPAPVPRPPVRRRRHRRLGEDDAARSAREVDDRGGPSRVPD
jgi:exopolyphosphatase / guanosine-5'-triphosphate,3'-diphosphate pyrophosphatase